jgi:hypothetical protein
MSVIARFCRQKAGMVCVAPVLRLGLVLGLLSQTLGQPAVANAHVKSASNFLLLVQPSLVAPLPQV